MSKILADLQEYTTEHSSFLSGLGGKSQQTDLELRNLLLLQNRVLHQAIMRRIGDEEAKTQV